MFKFDEESNLCWFNPASLENTEEYRLVGIVIGLAIYNSTILDIHLPLACFKKLLGLSVGLNDLGEQRPGFVRGLRQLLDYNNDLMNGGNVVGADHPCSIESVFGINFVAEYEAFGEVVMEPLLPHGEHIPVTRENRTEYVDKVNERGCMI